MDNTTNHNTSNCSCHGMDCATQHEDRQKMFTFELRWPANHPMTGCGEEIDVYAYTSADARRHGQEIMEEGYLKGAVLVEMQPGGSGGFFQSFSF